MSESHASEIAPIRRRPLTIHMIKVIHAAWLIPLESLIGMADQAA